MPNDDYQRIELITGTAHRRYYPTEEKLRIVEETMEPGATVSAVARRNGVAANLVFRWRDMHERHGKWNSIYVGVLGRTRRVECPAGDAR